MDLLQWAPIVTGIVAIYGAVLSTYNLIAARRDRAHKLRVSLKWGMAAPGPEPETVFILDAINPRGRPVTVAACGIVLPNGKSLVIHARSGRRNFLTNWLKERTAPSCVL